MKPERWRRIEDLFGRAASLPPQRWPVFLAEHAPDDPEIVGEVLRMLRARGGSKFIEPPTIDGPPAAPQASSWSGRALGDFDLIEELGRGGMGVVFRARQRSLQREVAVKVLPASAALAQRQVDRFEREARAAAKLHHPWIAQVFFVGREGDTRYFAMEYVGGCDLAVVLRWLRHQAAADDPVPIGMPPSHAGDYVHRVARIARDIADALHFAHAHGVVHRDVKPSNVLLEPSGSIKIVDFGLARDESLGAITQSGELAGTPHYMSPEQIRAQRREVDHRTDVYSLGVVLYELLTLRRPFDGETAHEVMQRISSGEPTRLRSLNPRISRDLATICEKAMARDAQRRYPDAAALRDDLDRFLSYGAISARPPGALERAWRFGRRRARGLATAALLLVAVVATAIWRAHHDRRVLAQEQLRSLNEVWSADDLEALPPRRLVELCNRVRRLRDAAAGLQREELDRLLAAETSLAKLRRDMLVRAETHLRAARSSGLDAALRQRQSLAGTQILLHATALFPDDEEIARLASVENGLPRVTVRAIDSNGDPVAAEVWMRRVDPSTSGVLEPIHVGKAPVQATPLLPGVVRIVVAFDAGGFREMICQPGADGMDLELTAVRRADEEQVTRGMVLIDACSYEFDDYPGEPGLQRKRVDLGAFWIDETEVSNDAYARFLRDTGNRAPPAWASIPDLDDFLANHGDLPVVGVSWADAVRFAEWSGKRLPTAAEWHRCSGGVEHRPFPYSADPAADLRGNLHAPRRTAFSEPEMLAWYLQYARPVRSAPDARTPEGVFNLYGNVDEWTESARFDRNDPERPIVHDFERFAFGGWWEAAALKWTCRQAAVRGIAPTEASWHTGFRCARSASP